MNHTVIVKNCETSELKVIELYDSARKVKDNRQLKMSVRHANKDTIQVWESEIKYQKTKKQLQISSHRQDATIQFCNKTIHVTKSDTQQRTKPAVSVVSNGIVRKENLKHAKLEKSILTK